VNTRGGYSLMGNGRKIYLFVCVRNKKQLECANKLKI
jgi:hypothetical protein